MSILDVNLGTGDQAISELQKPEAEEFRQALRRRLIAARGSTYTYKDPDGVATRAGGTIGNDGTIIIGMNRNAGTGFNSDRPLPTSNYIGHGGGGGPGNRGGGANGRADQPRTSPFVSGSVRGEGRAPREAIPNNPAYRGIRDRGASTGFDASDAFQGSDIFPGTSSRSSSGSSSGGIFSRLLEMVKRSTN